MRGLRVAAGAWLDRRDENNEREIAALVRLARENPNVDRVVVGNESILRGDLSVPALIADITRVKRKVRVPVSTAEPWHVWLRYPQLARHVDFITVHLLPYWEGVPAEHAVDYALARYAELRQRVPEEAHRDRRDRLAEPRRPDRRRDRLARRAGRVRPRLPRAHRRAPARLLPDGDVRPAVEAAARGPGGRVLGDAPRRPHAEVRPRRAGRSGRALAHEGARGVAPRRAADALVRVLVPAAAHDRPDRVLRADPGRGRCPGLARDDPARVLPRPGGLGSDRGPRTGGGGDARGAARERLRVRRGAVAPRVAARVPSARAGSARARAVRVDPSPGVQRAAGDGDPHPGFARAARLPELRGDRRRQQHARRAAVAPGRGPLRAARRPVPVLPPAGVARVQGRRAQFRAARDRRQRRGGRRRRRRLRGRPRLARAARRPFRRARRSRWCRRRRRTASSRTPRSGG